MTTTTTKAAAMVDLTADEDAPLTMHQVTIPGKPQAMPRPFQWKGVCINPKAKEAKTLGQKIKEQLGSSGLELPFPKGKPVSASIWFMMPRPIKDFVGRKAIAGRLKDAINGLIHPHTSAPDIDNLCKFVLDALNGIAYHDDRQVVQLKSLKLVDSFGACRGQTVIQFHAFDASIHGEPLPMENM